MPYQVPDRERHALLLQARFPCQQPVLRVHTELLCCLYTCRLFSAQQINAQAINCAQARREGSKFDLSVDTGACILKLGTSSDVGFCPAQKKVGACDAHQSAEHALL